ncbi:MAG: nucleoside triphosphate pyrophosphohydrolase [Coriobacteriia bacterium]
MGSIAIVGVGLDPANKVPPATLERLRRADRVVTSRASGALADSLAAEGIAYTPLSELGISPEAGVDSVIEGLSRLADTEHIAFATAAYPFLRQGLLSGLLMRGSGTVDVFPALTPLQIVLMAFDIDLTADLDIVDARALAPQTGERGSHLIVTGIGNRVVAQKVADRLLESYPPDYRVVLAGSLDDGGYELATMTLSQIGVSDLSRDATLYLAPHNVEPPGGFAEFVRVIGALRAPDGCPWDRAQDHHSLRRHMIEEAHEAVAAIESGDSRELADELGDVMLQVVLHAQIASEAGDFDIDDVIANITQKIRRRHPHIFGTVVAETPEAVIQNWDAIKREEKPGRLLDGIPRSLPALMLAGKISRRVVGVGFEWDTIDAVWSKVHEEIDELKACEPGSPEAAEEIGDLLFTIVNLARKQGIDPEEALRGTCAKFTRRWESMEDVAGARGENMEDLGIDTLEALWKQAKEETKT